MALLWMEARPFDATLTGTNLRRRITARHTFSAEHLGPPPRQLGQVDLDHLQAALHPPEPEDELLAVYRMGLTENDGAAAFLIYWNVLGRLTKRETQPQIDHLIETYEPDVEWKPSDRRKEGKETIFCHLRNRLAHGRPDAPALPEMRRQADRLRRIVWKALRDLEQGAASSGSGLEHVLRRWSS